MHEGWPDLDTAIATMDVLNHEQVEWQRVQRVGYLIHQHLRYEYPGPIYDLHQRLMILPPEQHGNQRCTDKRLAVSTALFEISCCDDDFGNKQLQLTIPQVEQAIDFEAWILVERSVEDGAHYLPAACLADTRLLEPSALTQPDAALRATATILLASGRQGLALAEYINHWTYEALRYTHEVTDIHTTAAEALALGRGVCQDYAHVMLALCHLCGLPARYVSGHMLGEGGTHAWVEVLFPIADRSAGVMVVPFDPTHGRKAGLNYLTVAVGHDYYDVAPTSGTFRAAYRGQLTAHKRVGLTLLEY